MPGLTLRLTREGREAVSPVTDANGEFRLGLSGGVYRLDLAANLQVGFSKDLPGQHRDRTRSGVSRSVWIRAWAENLLDVDPATT